MKKLIAIVLLTGVAGAAHADDFGQRFADSQPSALEDVAPQPELSIEDLQNIEPAAGEEALAVPASDDAQVMIEPEKEADEEFILSP